MSEGRALLTERERDAIAGELSDSYRYKTRSYVRRRIEKLAEDMETLAEHDPELYREALDALGDADSAEIPPAEAVSSGGRGGEPETPADTPPPSDGAGDTERDAASVDAALADMDFPEGQERAACIETIAAAVEYLQTDGPASSREVVTAVMPGHSLGYDVPELEAGDRYRGAWWRRIVKPALKQLPGVEYRANYGDYRAKEPTD